MGEQWLRRTWLFGTLVLTLGVTALLILASPDSGVQGPTRLQAVVLIGSSVHVAATAWFFTLSEVRAHARAHPLRFIVVPCVLVVATAVLEMLISPRRFAWFFVFYLAWQYWHYQKQNVGMAALAGISSRSRSLLPLERKCVIAAGVAGIAGLLAHPKLLGLTTYDTIRHVFPIAAVAYVVVVVVGLLALVKPGQPRRPLAFTVMYLMSLLFFAPVFLFSSPFAAAFSFAIAHGYQYLLLVAMLAGSSRLGRSRVLNLAALLLIAWLGGVALEHAMHGSVKSVVDRGLFGAALGVVMSHFVIDAGLWRLRDEFPRTFLTENLPYLLAPSAR